LATIFVIYLHLGGSSIGYGLLTANDLLMDNLLLRTYSTILLAYFTYKLIEQTILKWKKI